MGVQAYTILVSIGIRAGEPVKCDGTAVTLVLEPVDFYYLCIEVHSAG